MSQKKLVAGGTQLYEKIESYISDLITNGSLHPGDRLVSEREIGRLFNASNGPVRQALRTFIDRGILEKRHGSGTYVTDRIRRDAVTNKIAVVYCHSRAGFFSSSFYTAILSGMECQAQTYKKDLVLRSLMRDENEAPEDALASLADEVDGFILVDPITHVYERIEQGLRAGNKPVVLVNYEGPAADLDSVVVDSSDGIVRMTEFLLAQGHSRIACLAHRGANHRELPAAYRNRVDAWRGTLERHGIRPDDDLTLTFRHTKHVSEESVEHDTLLDVSGDVDKGDERAFRALMESPGRPTALLCVSDEIALYAYRLAHRMNLRIPKDITVTGFDNIRECSAAQPRLTSVHTPLIEMGMAAVKRFMEKTGDDPVSCSKTVLPVKVVPRESHRAVN